MDYVDTGYTEGYDDYDLFVLYTNALGITHFVDPLLRVMFHIFDEKDNKLVLYLRKEDKVQKIEEKLYNELVDMVKKHRETEFLLLLDSRVNIRADIDQDWIEAMFPYLYYLLKKESSISVAVQENKIYVAFNRSLDYAEQWEDLCNAVQDILINLYDQNALLLSTTDDLPLIKEKDLTFFDTVVDDIAVYVN